MSPLHTNGKRGDVMNALGIDTTDRDPVVGWETIDKIITTGKPVNSFKVAASKELLDMVWKKQLEVADSLETCEDDIKRGKLIEQSNIFVTIANYLQNQIYLHREVK